MGRLSDTVQVEAEGGQLVFRKGEAEGGQLVFRKGKRVYSPRGLGPAALVPLPAALVPSPLAGEG